MKRKYEYPKMEIIEFDTKDVITTSGVSDDDFLNGLDHVIEQWLDRFILKVAFSFPGS